MGSLDHHFKTASSKDAMLLMIRIWFFEVKQYHPYFSSLSIAGSKNDNASSVFLRVGSKITQVIPINVKDSRCCGIVSAKCPIFMGLLRTAYAKLFLYDP